MDGINGKVVAITGASGGIGEATGRLLAERGATVVLGARRTERLDKIAQEIHANGGRAITCATDVTRPGDLQRLVTTVSTAGLKIVPTQAVYAATKNAVRTLMEGLRQESTDGVLRTTAISPGFVRTDLADSIDNPEVREQIRRSRDEFAILPEAVARAIAFAIEQPDDVEIGDITIRPTVQG